jgi:D-glycero-D-manno-heptose 1,7-bisphosphate phosphatase
MKKPAVFIDRDGTISEEVGYVNHPGRFRVFPYSAEAIRKLNDNSWLAILVTNQAGVARGYFSEDVITTVHDQLNKQLAAPQRPTRCYLLLRSPSDRRATSLSTGM